MYLSVFRVVSPLNESVLIVLLESRILLKDMLRCKSRVLEANTKGPMNEILL